MRPLRGFPFNFPHKINFTPCIKLIFLKFFFNKLFFFFLLIKNFDVSFLNKVFKKKKTTVFIFQQYCKNLS